MIDPLQILEDAIAACETAEADEVGPLEGELVEAVREDGRALISELRQLRKIVERLPSMLCTIEVSDEVSINCLHGVAFVVEWDGRPPIGVDHDNARAASPKHETILDALAWLRSPAGVEIVEKARKL